MRRSKRQQSKLTGPLDKPKQAADEVIADLAAAEQQKVISSVPTREAGINECMSAPIQLSWWRRFAGRK